MCAIVIMAAAYKGAPEIRQRVGATLDSCLAHNRWAEVVDAEESVV
jgi:hypothetical protein